ncbi:ATP-grasp domain-containing protein [Alteromonas halophila]|uniref:ATP-grasp domain protein n=1 Tax=Alteromonas halophila TaxID=516698 RepID=A0A918JL65_9ALTE|nr:hypothetical protein [Alteromonas halophila]GGW84385.1 ATP-grasp domain protein [Alteromonas halophila]
MTTTYSNKLAFLSTDNLEDFFVYDELLIPYFNDAGWAVETISWHQKGVDWNSFDAVIVRSTWDYQTAPQAFSTCLTEIGESDTHLENPLPLMRWNMRKTYLRDLTDNGVATIPTVWLDSWEQQQVNAQFARFNTDTLIVKPVLSANADDTFRLNKAMLERDADTLAAVFSQRALMVQPFISNILEEGEYSLFYFDGALSHAIVKRPASGDFRVQEEHGGQLALVTPDAGAIKMSEAALAAMPNDALYARIDLVRYQGQYRVMEVELIEPSLYFQLDDASPQRFVDAFLRRHGRFRGD